MAAEITCNQIIGEAHVSAIPSVVDGVMTFAWFAVCQCGETVTTDAGSQDEAQAALDEHRSSTVWHKATPSQ